MPDSPDTSFGMSPEQIRKEAEGEGVPKVWQGVVDGVRTGKTIPQLPLAARKYRNPFSTGDSIIRSRWKDEVVVTDQQSAEMQSVLEENRDVFATAQENLLANPRIRAAASLVQDAAAFLLDKESELSHDASGLRPPNFAEEARILQEWRQKLGREETFSHREGTGRTIEDIAQRRAASEEVLGTRKNAVPDGEFYAHQIESAKFFVYTEAVKRLISLGIPIPVRFYNEEKWQPGEEFTIGAVDLEQITFAYRGKDHYPPVAIQFKGKTVLLNTYGIATMDEIPDTDRYSIWDAAVQDIKTILDARKFLAQMPQEREAYTRYAEILELVSYEGINAKLSSLQTSLSYPLSNMTSRTDKWKTMLENPLFPVLTVPDHVGTRDEVIQYAIAAVALGRTEHTYTELLNAFSLLGLDDTRSHHKLKTGLQGKSLPTHTDIGPKQDFGTLAEELQQQQLTSFSVTGATELLGNKPARLVMPVASGQFERALPLYGRESLLVTTEVPVTAERITLTIDGQPQDVTTVAIAGPAFGMLSRVDMQAGPMKLDYSTGEYLTPIYDRKTGTYFVVLNVGAHAGDQVTYEALFTKPEHGEKQVESFAVDSAKLSVVVSEISAAGSPFSQLAVRLGLLAQASGRQITTQDVEQAIRDSLIYTFTGPDNSIAKTAPGGSLARTLQESVVGFVGEETGGKLRVQCTHASALSAAILERILPEGYDVRVSPVFVEKRRGMDGKVDMGAPHTDVRIFHNGKFTIVDATPAEVMPHNAYEIVVSESEGVSTLTQLQADLDRFMFRGRPNSTPAHADLTRFNKEQLPMLHIFPQLSKT